jgi:hypothetical protein
MITPRESPPRAVLERIADDFRRRGYDVVVEPRGRDLPSFLAHATPDLIARRGDENLVVEVRRLRRDVDPTRLSAVAERVAREPGWRFVLMATRPEDATEDGELATLDEATLRQRLAEADALPEKGHPEAALMVAWAATEGIIRLLVARHRIPIERDDAPVLIRTLASEGYVDEHAFRELNDAFRLRSAVAHGRRSLEHGFTAEAHEATRALARHSQALLRELPASA